METRKPPDVEDEKEIREEEVGSEDRLADGELAEESELPGDEE